MEEGLAAQLHHTQQANMLEKTLFIFSIFSAAALALASDVHSIRSGERAIVQFASNDPALSTFVTALKAANLTAKFSGAGDGDRQTDGPFVAQQG